MNTLFWIAQLLIKCGLVEIDESICKLIALQNEEWNSEQKQGKQQRKIEQTRNRTARRVKSVNKLKIHAIGIGRHLDNYACICSELIKYFVNDTTAETMNL